MIVELFESMKTALMPKDGSMNQVLATGLTLYVVSVVTLVVRGVPKKISAFVLRNFTTSLTLASYNESFHRSIGWFEDRLKGRSYRRIRIFNGRWGSNKDVKSIGFGHHWVWYRRHLLYVELLKESANNTVEDKLTLKVSMLGRSHKTFDRLLEEFAPKSEDGCNSVEVRKYGTNGWFHLRDIKKRPLSSVFLTKASRNGIVDRIKRFVDSEEWYLRHGIPYQMGIMLYGPPGTGKTSLIKAIAAEFDYSIYYLPAKQMNNIEAAMSLLSDNCIVVIEDIDSSYMVNPKEDIFWTPEPEKAPPAPPLVGNSGSGSSEVRGPSPSDFGGPEDNERKRPMGLSEVLNAMDGIMSSHGRILVTTTNRIHDLDPAVLRPGRIDLKIEIGYVCLEVANSFLASFFTDCDPLPEDSVIRDKLTVAGLQELVLRGDSVEEIKKHITGGFDV